MVLFWGGCNNNQKRQMEIAEIWLIRGEILQFTIWVTKLTVYFSPLRLVTTAETDLSLLFTTAWQMCVCVRERNWKTVCVSSLDPEFCVFLFFFLCNQRTISLSLTHTDFPLINNIVDDSYSAPLPLPPALALFKTSICFFICFTINKSLHYPNNPSVFTLISFHQSSQCF